MTLLAKWGKLYQVTSEVGYGVMTDETRCAVMCIFHIWIWLFASSLCVTVAFVQVAKVVRPPDNERPVNKEILIAVDGDSGPQARPVQGTPGSMGT
jgi:hypothetical protein